MKKITSLFLTLIMLLTVFVSNPLAAEAKGEDWYVDEKYGGKIEEYIHDGKRYMLLSSTSSNDNGGKPAIMRPSTPWEIDGKEGSLSLSFIPLSAPKNTRFAVFLYFQDPENFLSVGYDAGGWFWEYKIEGHGDWYKGNRIPSPEANTPITLDIELKDHRVIATTTINDKKTEVINHIFDAQLINKLSEQSKDVVLKLGTWGSDYSQILIEDSDQADIPVIHDKERPELDRYDEYEVNIDFKDASINEDIFDVRKGTSEITATEEGLIINFKDKGKNILTFNELALLENFEMEMSFTPLDMMNRFGFAYRVEDGAKYSTASSHDKDNFYFGEAFTGGSSRWTDAFEGPKLTINESHKMKLKVNKDVVSLWVDDTKVFEEQIKGISQGDLEYGLFKDRGAGKVRLESLKIKRIVPERPSNPSEEISLVEIENEAMSVEFHETFPAVYRYQLSDGKQMWGQVDHLDTMKINGQTVSPKVEILKHDDNLIDYGLVINDEEHGIHAKMTVRFLLENNTLTMKIIDIEKTSKEASIIKTIEFPNHSLVSVHSDEENAHILGAMLSVNTTKNGDRHHKVTEKMRDFSERYMYSVIYKDDVAASMHSNSQYGQNFERLTASAKEYTDFVSVGLASSPFIYHKDQMYDEHTIDEPELRIVLTSEDLNRDGKIDWQDGAIAFRDIMYSPVGAESVKDLVAYRIAMTFGSHAQNPFLKTLDNIKKVNLHTHGLGQSILVKGYGSEGHDSGHLDYANIGERIGGTEDFVYLLKAAKDYGAEIGIHVNASETYPESKYFKEELLRKNRDGSFNYGWNWLDQGINIDAAYDLANGRRARWEELREKVGPHLDWVYVDVWGNGQSGDNGSWASHQLAKEIHDQGWRLGGEWGYAFEPDSTFQHWATDLPYGGYSLKGINSSLTRFIFNHQRDAWVADKPEYRGAAENPLLGGYNMTDFEGWQGRNDYEKYMTNLFEHNVPTKFLQHYQVMQWIEGTPVKMPHPGGQGSFEWTPEMKIVLSDNEGNVVKVTRKSNDYENEYDLYRSREIFYNERKVLDGDSYLLPWFWNEKGEKLSYEKLYHFNKQGGKTTWEVPSSWSGEVLVYELSELGLKSPQKVTIKNGEITIDAKAKSAYVVSNQKLSNREVEWGEGTPLVDPGFNAQNLDAWNVKGDDAKVSKTEANNEVLEIKDNKEINTVSQTLRNLKAGEEYVAYVNVDNRSNSQAFLEIHLPDGIVKRANTGESIAKNYVKAEAHNTNAPTVDGNSKFQNMFVHFTAPKEGDVKLVLGKEVGEGSAYFDDVRVTTNKGNPWIDNDTFFQDFENNAQGIYPFVVGNVEGVEDNRTHLSELHDPYTQRGWNNKVISDVIDGKWSLKTNGLVRRNRLVYQTIPQNVYFEPNRKYKVSFDYEQGSDDTYALIIGDGPYTGKEEKIPLKATLDKDGPQKYTFEITGSETGQTWFGIYSSNVPADTKDSSDKEANFRSYADFIMDNVLIQKESSKVEYQKDKVKMSGSSKYLFEKAVFDYEKEAKPHFDNYRFFVEKHGHKMPLYIDAEEDVSIEIPLREDRKLERVEVLTMDDVWKEIPYEDKNNTISLLVKNLQGLRVYYETGELNTHKLDELIGEFEKLDPQDYTEESWKKVLSVVDKINAKYGKWDDQSEIDNLHKILKDTLDELVKVDKEDQDEKGEDQSGSKPGEDQSGSKPGEDQSGSKPGEDQSGSKPGEDQSGSKPGEDQSGSKPGEDQPGSKPGEDQSGSKPGEDQPGSKPGEDQPGSKPGEDQSTSNKLSKDKLESESLEQKDLSEEESSLKDQDKSEEIMPATGDSRGVWTLVISMFLISLGYIIWMIHLRKD